MKYFVIESSPFGKNVIGNFNTKVEAEKKIDSLIPIERRVRNGRKIIVGECFCDYYITKLIS